MRLMLNEVTSLEEGMVGGFVAAGPRAAGVIASEAQALALPAKEGASSNAGMVGWDGRPAKPGERSRGHRDRGVASIPCMLRQADEALPGGR